MDANGLEITPSAPGHHFPHSRTLLIGRENELATVTDLLQRDGVPLLTLTGPGGVGKTRLAFAAAERLMDGFPDGVWSVSLAPLSDPDLVVTTTAAVLGVAEQPGRALVDLLADHIGVQRMLLVLDNLEHLLEAVADIASLIAACPNLRFLITSRTPLHIYGEQEFPVPPLDVPEMESRLSVKDLTRSEAIELFVARAGAVRPSFRLSAENAPHVLAICRRLDGLPLAIELAAARTRVFSSRELLARLERPLAVLIGGPRNVPTRQQTLRNTIAWSYNLLNENEQRLFRQFAIFRGDSTLEAIEMIADQVIDVADTLEALIEHSLVQVSERSAGQNRYGMLETIRDFGLERLAESGEGEQSQERHAAHYAELAEQTKSQLHGASEPRLWLEQFDAELGNLRAAFDWAAGREDAATAIRLSVSLAEYMEVRGHYQENRRRLETALALGGEVSPQARADAVIVLGVLVRELGEYDLAEELHTQAIALYQEAGNLVGVADGYATLGMLAMYRGDYDRSHDLFEQALVPARRSGDRRTLSNVLGSAAIIAAVDGDYELATGFTEESLSLLREVGDVMGVARTFRYLGYYALWRNDLDDAECMAQEGLSRLRELGDTDSLMFAQQLLAQIELERRRYSHSETHFRECLEYLGVRQMMAAAECLEGLAGVAAETGGHERAARLLGAAASVRERSDTPLPPPRRERHERTVGAARARLSDEAFEAALAKGRSWELEQAIAYGLEPGDAPPVAPEATPALRLTPRELEVLRLLVDGLSNQEIAASLFVSPHTAATHIANIMNKLGVDSRTAAATWAIRQGLA